MKTLILGAIRCSLMFTAVTGSLFSGRAAQAYSVTLQQVGSDVVATGSGAKPDNASPAYMNRPVPSPTR
jgi:hypothetical protein